MILYAQFLVNINLIINEHFIIIWYYNIMIIDQNILWSYYQLTNEDFKILKLHDLYKVVYCYSRVAIVFRTIATQKW